MLSMLVKTLYFWFLFRVRPSVCENDGWIPLAKEDAYDKFLREPAARFLVRHNVLSHEVSPDIQKLKDDAIKMAMPHNRLQINQDNAINSPLNQHSGSQKYQQICGNEDCSDIGNDEQNESSLNNKKDNEPTISFHNKTEINKRKPKYLDTAKSVNRDDLKPIDRVFYNDDANQEHVRYEINYTNGKNNMYKVIEDNSESAVTDDAELSGNSPEIDLTNQNGYIYKPPTPDAKHSTDSNITNNFLGILSKYNIKVGDDLPNYILSRRHRVGNQNYMLIPIPLKIPPRLNSLNHLVADPLLAVFLSNYGYYLPGLYGIQSKYRNLYGYLASNNIHNNKPFGSYKIFSDTDSSN